MPNGDILIVDDASFMRQMIREIVEPEGYEVVGEAANGIDGVKMFRELRPDLVTMDVVMPKCSGIDAVKGILLIEPEALIIMCSALGQEIVVMEALQAGASDFIIKPYYPERVAQTFQKVLQGNQRSVVRA